MTSPGDTIIVRGGFGHEPEQRVTVLDVGEEAGLPVVEYIDHHGRTRWAYEWQIVGVIAPDLGPAPTDISTITAHWHAGPTGRALALRMADSNRRKG